MRLFLMLIITGTQISGMKTAKSQSTVHDIIALVGSIIVYSNFPSLLERR